MRLSATALRSAVSARSRGSLSRTRRTILQATVTSRMINDAYVTRVTEKTFRFASWFCQSPGRPLVVAAHVTVEQLKFACR